MFWKNICLLVLGCAVGVLSAPKRRIPCALYDLPCTSLTADSLFKRVMSGIPDIKVPSSDPIRVKALSGQIDNMFYKFTDAEMHGFANCTVKSHSINVLQLSWTLLLHCPQLALKSDYEVSGTIDGIPIEGKGRSNIVHDKYRMALRGGFEFTIDPKGRTHMHVISYGFDRLEAVGNIKTELSNLYNGDVAKSNIMHEYLNDNWKRVGFYTQLTIMPSFVRNVIENINTFFGITPTNELFFREE